jgi:hypothetical protein
MAVEARRGLVTRPGAFAWIGKQLGINPKTLRNWGDPGRQRRGQPAGDHDRRRASDRRTGAAGPEAAPGERDSRDRVGVFAQTEVDRRLR